MILAFWILYKCLLPRTQNACVAVVIANDNRLRSFATLIISPTRLKLDLAQYVKL